MTIRADAYDPKLIDFDVFALFLEARRIHRKKSAERVAREAEVSLDAVIRAARGRNPGAVEFFALCDWIGEKPGLFVKRSKARPAPGREAVLHG